jgi:hypothetical protein
MTEKKKAAPKKSAKPKEKTVKKGTKPTLVKKEKVVEVLPIEPLKEDWLSKLKKFFNL